MKNKKHNPTLMPDETQGLSERVEVEGRKKEKSISRRLLNHLFWTAALALVVGGGLYLTFSTDMIFKSSLLEQEKINLEIEINELKDENYILRQKLERLKVDPGYVEDEARKKLGLVRPGEIIYRLSEEPDLGPESPPPAPVSPQQ